MSEIEKYSGTAIALLKQLISTPSFSKEENATAELIGAYLSKKDIPFTRIGNNIIARNRFYDEGKKSILLNSHHDTVRPNSSYKNDPFDPLEKDGKLYGLGSNDAGGCLVSLIETFCFYFNRDDLKYNLILAATAEEEISGSGGVELILNELPPISFAIVGEPTQLEMAVAERGLMVLDCISTGKAGHAAREEGENALYKAVKDIQWIESFKFGKNSSLLGPVKMTVTVIETSNKAHNVVPDQCHFVVDVRVNENYSFEEILDTIGKHVGCSIKPRSTRLRSTAIPLDHDIVKAGLKLGKGYYGSPTTSDKALLPFPALKVGPGDSARSHIADEYIYIDEIRMGIDFYIQLLKLVIL